MFLFYLFLFLICIGVPIAYAMGLIPMAYIFLEGSQPVRIVPYKMYQIIDNFCFSAIPLFILGGNLITSIGVTQKLIVFSDDIVGRVRGGLSHVNVVASTIFGGLNGSAVADAAAVGSILIKPMKEAGFTGGFAAAVSATSGTISGIIPPSIPFIIFATVVPELSIGALFIGGIVPGVMICIGQCIAGYFLSVWKKIPVQERPFSIRIFIKNTFKATPALLLVGIIIFGLRSGIFSPTEVASIIVMYAFVLGFIIYRNLNLKILAQVLHETAVTTGIIFLIIGCAGPFMWLITRMGVTAAVCQTMVEVSENPFIWWLLLSFFLLVAGMIMDTVANILVLGPMVYMAAKAAGFDPFVSAIAIVILLTMGVSTPPVGISLYATCSIAKSSIENTSVYAIPFLLAEAAVVVLILAFPEVAKFLPNLFGYGV